jgi:kynurenine formamidase
MKVIDLSLPIYSGMEVFPGDPEVNIETIHTHENEGWELRKISMGSHTGTHVDAFSHMHEDGSSLSELPLERFFGKAQVVRLTDQWPTDQGLFFTEEIDIDWLEQLLAARPPFVGGEITEALERALLENEVITYTNLVNLEQIPRGKTFMFYGLPLNIQAGDGSPVRAMAMIEE